MVLEAFVGTDFDVRQLDRRAALSYRLVLYSRWLDSDSDIVTGNFTQTPVDITKWVASANLNLTASRDASTASIRVNLQSLPVDLFYNCVVQIQEGVIGVDPVDWPITFTGWHIGQPRASEPNTQDLRPVASSLGERGRVREVDVTFSDRAILFNNQRLTSPGLWFPRGDKKQDDETYAARDDYDDIGNIAREIATADWGMGLTGGEVLIGPLPYRIQKQLQIVNDSVLEALTTILQPLHLVPTFNGEGKLTVFSERVTKEAVRDYDRAQIISIPQSQANQDNTNAVHLTGLDSQITEVIYANQRLLQLRGTFGYFDSSIVFRGTWGDDEDSTFRVKVGSVVDGNGESVSSPRIVNFESEGFIIDPVGAPAFLSVTEFEYEIEVTNDVFLVVAAIAAFFGGYAGLVIVAAVLPDVPVTNTQDVPNPIAIVANIAASILLLAGLFTLQQIGNFEFEVEGVPFETVYRELTAEAILTHFATFDPVDVRRRREYEKRSEDVENHVFSSLDDAVLTDTFGGTNKGMRTWCEERLAYLVARQAARTVNVPRDFLLEPGDALQADQQIVFVDSISRTLERGSATAMQINGFQIRKVG